ncbi:hypothetical protein fHeYen902_189 [Yersinia phage fHe-Yen9-02]|nr:hypothetical protein fHeYen902_189 [Yersinia phage fHe-Yen9-02]
MYNHLIYDIMSVRHMPCTYRTILCLHNLTLTSYALTSVY